MNPSVYVALLGDPVSHSLSPLMHNAAFESASLNWQYLALRVSKENLCTALRSLLSMDFRGLNVTVPHKRAVIACLDELTPRAEAIGAVNTVLFENGRALGDNTDARGLVLDLRSQGLEIAGKSVLLLGAGGAARAALYGILEESCTKVTVLNRTLSRAQELVATMSKLFPEAELAAHTLGEELCMDGFDLLIQCTSLGLDGESNPWPYEDFANLECVYDMIYQPSRTPLMKAAEKAGCRVLNGRGMLAAQGSLAWAWWTKGEPPLNLMRQVLENEQRL